MSVWGTRWGLTWGKSFGDVAPPAPPATGKFNALSLAKIGVGFGALAVASIGLLAPSIIIGNRIERVRARSFIGRSVFGVSRL
jgi:hypothetical protein